MNDNVSYLSGEKLPDVQAMNMAVSAFLGVFQKQQFAFQPTLHDLIKRHASLLDENQNNVRLGLKALLAQLSDEPLQLVLEGLEKGDDADLLSLAQELRDDVLTPLASVINCLKADSDGFSSLPTIDGSTERSHLEKNGTALQEEIGRLSKLVEDEQKKRATLSDAIKALEAKEVKLDLSGLVPTSEQLSALAVPGAEAKLALDAATKAMKDLEKMMGSLLEGMQYSELQERRREVIKRVADLEREVSDKSRQIKDIERQQTMLDVIPELLAYAAGWVSTVRAIIGSLEGQCARLKGASIADVQDVNKLNALFAEILNYNKSLLDLISKA
ncbi:alpha-xenorhabdolysin family binary toxin subunit B [Pseudomonas plecoglossicida]|uniref:alpha-xenorhabdolysin family binary toxin subunit B n=1 Tax=Pseudomonas plecoglossicida TaxID=70775 RepID=UPI003D1BFA78